jgi:hypothetical protein
MASNRGSSNPTKVQMPETYFVVTEKLAASIHNSGSGFDPQPSDMALQLFL